MTQLEFEKQFDTQEKCLAYIESIRYQGGRYSCHKCGCTKVWVIERKKHKEAKKQQKPVIPVYECAQCGYHGSVISGTIFQDTHKSLVLWFRAIWHIVSQKNGTSALNIQRQLGIGSYKTAWLWLHKLRRAMVVPGRDKLSGVVEVDEALFGGAKKGKRGRGADSKVLAAIAVEINDNKVGRIRIQIISAATKENLNEFVLKNVEKGSTVVTDGWGGYNDLESKGYIHEVSLASKDNASESLPHVHTVVSLIKRWIIGTLQGSCSAEHMAYYFDEFTFRFNRRTSKSRGKLFYRMVQNAVCTNPTIYSVIVQNDEVMQNTCVK